MVPKVNFVDITTEKLKTNDQLKILQISDYHDIRSTKIEFFILEKIKELSPDIIAITGDLLDENTKDYRHIYRFIEQLIDINPNVFFVSGNHEWKSGNIEEFIFNLKMRNVRILSNTNYLLVINDYSIFVCGVEDYHSKHSNIEMAMKGINSKSFTVFLSHSPGIVSKEKGIEVDLILSGHTHGGQIRFPFIGALISPGQGLFPRFQKGIYEINHLTKLYIDSGLGTSTIPVRFHNRSQISFITVKGK